MVYHDLAQGNSLHLDVLARPRAAHLNTLCPDIRPVASHLPRALLEAKIWEPRISR